MRLFFGTLLLLAVVIPGYGQKIDKAGCGYEGLDPWFVNFMENRDQFQFDIPEEPVWVPMVVHVVGDDDGNGFFPTTTLLQSLCQLNEDFAAVNMQFYVPEEFNYIADSDYYEHDFGTGATMMRRNNVDNRVNCYIVGDPAGTCGYFSGQGDAVALSKSCNSPNDHTWAHELGHFFSLPHTFVGWEGTDYEGSIPGGNRRGVENVARNNCGSTADRFCDTPADYLSFRWSCSNDSFSTIVQTDPSGTEFRSDGRLFMSYASDRCMNKFSQEQMDAMNANLRTRRRDVFVNTTPLGPITEMVDLLDPPNGESMKYDEARVTWSSVENATGYYVRVSRIPTLSGLFEFEGIVTDTFVDLPELVIGRTYYWRIQAFNEFYFCTNPTSRSGFLAAETTSSRDIEIEDVQVIPNPIGTDQSFLQVVGAEWTKETDWNILSTDGKRIGEGQVKNGRIKLTGDLSPGVYHLLLQNREKMGATKIVVR